MTVRIALFFLVNVLLLVHAFGQRVAVDAHIECWRDASGGVSYEASSTGSATGLTESNFGWRFSITGDVVAFSKSSGRELYPRGFPCNNSDIISQNDVQAGSVTLNCNVGGTDGMCGETLRFRSEALLKDPHNPLSLGIKDGEAADCCPDCSPVPGDDPVPPWDEFSPVRP